MFEFPGFVGGPYFPAFLDALNYFLFSLNFDHSRLNMSIVLGSSFSGQCLNVWPRFPHPKHSSGLTVPLASLSASSAALRKVTNSGSLAISSLARSSLLAKAWNIPTCSSASASPAVAAKYMLVGIITASSPGADPNVA